ncbi:MAG TPA: PAS domain S-box protein [Ignavibacteriales bacterium]|nr:PAS domain S-box protein [Ignavibacteriales bacterium]
MNASQKTILLVEDEAIIAMAEKNDLTAAGFNVLIAFSGEQAVKMTDENPEGIDLILMDINLGEGIDGAEAAKRILKKNDIPVIFLSSHAEPDVVDKVDKITSYGYVVKGSNNTILFASIRMAFRLFEANRKIKQNEAALKQSEEKFRQLFENMTNGCALFELVYDEEGTPFDVRNIAVNPALEKITGIPVELLQGRTFLELDPAIDRTLIKEYIDVAATGTPMAVERYYPEINKYLNLWIFSYQKNQAASIFYDITERKKAEEKLIYSYNLLSYFIKHARSAIAILDRNMNYLYVSDEFLRQYKIKDQDITGKNHYDVFPDLPENWKEVHRQALHGVVLSAEEDPYPREDGSLEWIRWECRPWYEADGNIGGIILNTELITEKLKSAENFRRLSKEIMQSENKFRTLFENSPVGILITREGKILNANNALCEMFGYSDPEELTGKPALDSVVLEDRHLLKNSRRDWTSNEKKPNEFTVNAVKKDGTKFPVFAAIDHVWIHEGEVAITFCTDMTEIVKKEDRIKASLKEKELLLKEIHHRVKNNLQVISSLISLQSDYMDKTTQEEAFRESRNRIKTISLVHEKLYRSNSLSNVDVGDYIRALIANLRNAYSGQGSMVEVREDCEQASIPIDVATSCGLILNEIISNAFKYAFQGRIDGVLSFSVKNRKTEIEIMIKDNGPGLPEGMDMNKSGTLGQILISSLAAQLGGNLEITNDSGAKYTFTIPVKW